MIFQKLPEQIFNCSGSILAERLTGTEVTVCDELEVNCSKCGETPYADRGEYALVKCAEGTKGSIVKFLTRTNFFQACEIEIYGKSTPKG